MYDISYDAGAHLLQFSLRGFWTLDMVPKFAADLLKTVQTIPRGRGNFAVLSMTSDFPVQSTEVSDALGNIMAVADAMNTGRKAIVVGSFMNKLQAERTLGRSNVRVFMNIDDARAWLAAPGNASE